MCTAEPKGNVGHILYMHEKRTRLGRRIHCLWDLCVFGYSLSLDSKTTLAPSAIRCNINSRSSRLQREDTVTRLNMISAGLAIVCALMPMDKLFGLWCVPCHSRTKELISHCIGERWAWFLICATPRRTQEDVRKCVANYRAQCRVSFSLCDWDCWCLYTFNFELVLILYKSVGNRAVRECANLSVRICPSSKSADMEKKRAQKLRICWVADAHWCHADWGAHGEKIDGAFYFQIFARKSHHQSIRGVRRVLVMSALWLSLLGWTDFIFERWDVCAWLCADVGVGLRIVWWSKFSFVDEI